MVSYLHIDPGKSGPATAGGQQNRLLLARRAQQHFTLAVNRKIHAWEIGGEMTPLAPAITILQIQ